MIQETFRYALEEAGFLEFPPEKLREHVGTSVESLSGTLRESLAASLEDPLNFPSLAKALVPGDRVAIVPDAVLPRERELVAELIRWLTERSVEPEKIALLQTSDEEDAGCFEVFEELPKEIDRAVRRVTHDPQKKESLSILATDDAGLPITMNRSLVEADVVLPIGRFLGRYTNGYYGLNSPLYPRFSDAETIERFLDGGETLQYLIKNARHRARTVEEVARLLGIAFTIQVIPAGHGEIAAIASGEMEAVRVWCNRFHRKHWERKIPHRVSLVVATLEGDQRRQSWAELGRLLSQATAVVEDGGAIVVCSQLETPPGNGVQMLQNVATPGEALGALRMTRPDDAEVAVQLLRATDQAKVYLYSHLDSMVVEDCEMIPLESLREINRLIDLHPSCVLAANAPMAGFVVDSTGKRSSP
jgi:nickel-dependent lactate racemase